MSIRTTAISLLLLALEGFMVTMTTATTCTEPGTGERVIPPSATLNVTDVNSEIGNSEFVNETNGLAYVVGLPDEGAVICIGAIWRIDKDGKTKAFQKTANISDIQGCSVYMDHVYVLHYFQRVLYLSKFRLDDLTLVLPTIKVPQGNGYSFMGSFVNSSDVIICGWNGIGYCHEFDTQSGAEGNGITGLVLSTSAQYTLLKCKPRIIISDYYGSKVLVLTKNWKVNTTIDTGISLPLDAVGIRDGNVLVAEGGAERVSEITNDGSVLHFLEPPRIHMVPFSLSYVHPNVWISFGYLEGYQKQGYPLIVKRYKIYKN